MRARPLLILLLALLCPALRAQDIGFFAATNHSEPLSRFEKGQLSGGIIKDLGDALARRMGLRPRDLTMPSKRAPMALRNGQGDLLCYTRPQWIGPDYRFTLPLIPNAEVVAARPEARRLRRQDAPDMQANLRKLVAKRMAYAITDRLVLRAYQRQHPGQRLREDLVLNAFTAPCALSPLSPLELDAVNAARAEMVADGELQRILASHGH